MKNAAQEAKDCLDGKCDSYFRNFSTLPSGLVEGSKVFYVEDGYIRGFGVVSQVGKGTRVCETTLKHYMNGYKAVIPANTWKWIKPIQMKGFQGFRYFKGEYEVVGDWRAPKPNV